MRSAGMSHFGISSVLNSTWNCGLILLQAVLLVLGCGLRYRHQCRQPTLVWADSWSRRTGLTTETVRCQSGAVGIGVGCWVLWQDRNEFL